MARAAERARMSKARWVQIENGRETRRGQVRPVRAKAVTIAHMAYAVSVPPERLESEGRNPEAAAILREIIRQGEARAPSPQGSPKSSVSLEHHTRHHAPEHLAKLTPPIDAERIVQARRYADDIYARLLDLAADGKPNPSGAEIFPDSDRDAETWDRREDDLPMRERVWLIAGFRAHLASQLQSDLQHGCQSTRLYVTHCRDWTNVLNCRVVVSLARR
jgi:hypothetical protein